MVIESDSTCTLKRLENPYNSKQGSSSLIRVIKDLQTQSDNFILSRIFHEANFCVDTLAKHAQHLSTGLHHFKAPPAFLAPFLDADRREWQYARFRNV
ncbi:hypothetical protein AHAS_Ahas15G0148900 [Arachis hypogaea]